jgi:MoaA/NifB/PqqE/SkfB family radical SAM enzyme
MQTIKSRWNHQDKIKIEWNLGKRCNYDCTYCPSSIHDNSSLHTDINILTNTVDKLLSIDRPLRISLTGGEPCVHPNIEELIQYIKASGSWLSVTTNGTRRADWYSRLPVDQFVFSLHFEYDWQSVLNTIKAVVELNQTIQILVHVMAHQDKMQEVKEAVSFLEQHEIEYAVRRIRWTEGDHDVFDDMKYSQTDLDWLLSKTSTVKPNVIVDDAKLFHANDLIKLKLNQYKGWTCNIGLESLMINWNGDVHRATCRVGNSLGNIYNYSFVIPTEPVICTRNYCTCAADIPITKQS